MRSPAVLLLALLLVLTGCAGGTDGSGGDKDARKKQAPKVVVPEVGQCVAKETADHNDVAPDFTTVVDCTKPHVYEVIAVRPIPSRFLDTSSEAASLARRTQLAEVGDRAGRRNKRLHAVMWPGCDQAFREATGVDRFTFKGKQAKALRINPLGRNISPWLNLAPEKVWTENTAVVCTVRYAGPAPKGQDFGPVREVASKTERPVISTWMTAAFPQPFRLCHRIKTNQRVPCSVRHGIEYLWTADFKAAFGKGFLDGFDNLAALPQDEYGTAVSLCRRLYRQTGNRIPQGMRVNYRFNPELDDPSKKTLQMSCVLQTKNDRDRLTGFTSLR